MQDLYKQAITSS